jgi:ParB/RepB/Spo0J family partition protein
MSRGAKLAAVARPPAFGVVKAPPRSLLEHDPSRWADVAPVNAIVIGERARKDMRDVEALAASIARRGLLHAIVVRPIAGGALELVAGERRLTACRDVLGWDHVPVRIVDVDDVLAAEHDENAEREPFLPTEAAALMRSMGPELAGRVGKAAGERRGKTRDIVGKFAGYSGETMRKIAAVVAAAEEDPERFRALLEEMDRTGRVNGVFGKLRRARDEQRVLGLKPVEGRFATIVLDFPWEDDGLSPQGIAASIPYATMSHAELRALPVASWAADECHCYSWAKPNNVWVAADLMKLHGFEPKVLLTWRKTNISLGRYFRNRTEHVVFGVKGGLMTRPAARSIPTDFEGPSGDHSEKPESFYDIVRAASYGPYGEAFQRQPRPDFVNLYEPAQAALEAAE